MSSTDVSLPAPPPGGWWRSSKEDLAAALRAAEELRNHAEALQAAVLAEVKSRGVFDTYGYGSLEVWLRHLLRVDTGEARKRAARAILLHPSREGAGEKAAVAPLTAQAAAAGEINPGHVDAITQVMDAIPATVPEQDRAGYEQALLDLARQAAPALVRRAGRHVLALLDPDGTEPADERELAEPDRELLLSWTRDNRLRLKGTLDAETGQLFETLLSALAKPRPTVTGERDTRSPGQRQGDAFAELLELTQRAAERPTEAGETPVVMVSVTLDQLLGLNRSATLDGLLRQEPLLPAERVSAAMAAGGGGPVLNWETPITAEQARRLACDARIVPAVLGSSGEVLDLGRETRTATRAQRRALVLRDGGCVMCCRTPRWCQVHHLRHWVEGGPSDLDNMVLLCSSCHRLVHHAGWEIRMARDGRPEAIPPAWLDPTRQPRRFTAPHVDPLAA